MTGFENFRALVELEDNLENLDRQLNILATKIVDEMRADAPKDTGALKRSIKLNLDRYGFTKMPKNFLPLKTTISELST